MRSIDEFRAACKKRDRQMVKTFAVAIGGTLLLLALFGMFGSSVKPFWIGKVSDPAAEILTGLTPAPLVVFVFAVIYFGERRANSDPILHCPHCDIALNGPMTTASHNCQGCGKRVLADPE